MLDNDNIIILLIYYYSSCYLLPPQQQTPSLLLGFHIRKANSDHTKRWATLHCDLKWPKDITRINALGIQNCDEEESLDVSFLAHVVFVCFARCCNRCNTGTDNNSRQNDERQLNGSSSSSAFFTTNRFQLKIERRRMDNIASYRYKNFREA